MQNNSIGMAKIISVGIVLYSVYFVFGCSEIVENTPVPEN